MKQSWKSFALNLGWSTSLTPVDDLEKSDKRALHQGRRVPYLIVTLLLLFLPLPPLPVGSRAAEPQEEHEQSQQHQAHGQGQQHSLQHARRPVWSCRHRRKQMKKQNHVDVRGRKFKIRGPHCCRWTGWRSSSPFPGGWWQSSDTGRTSERTRWQFGQSLTDPLRQRTQTHEWLD